MAARRADARCSFCGKKPDRGRKLIAGPGVSICYECVELANEIINSEPPAMPEPPSSSGRRAWKALWLRRWFHIEVTQPAYR